MPRLNGVKRLQVTNLQKNKNDYPQIKLSNNEMNKQTNDAIMNQDISAMYR